MLLENRKIIYYVLNKLILPNTFASTALVSCTTIRFSSRPRDSVTYSL